MLTDRENLIEVMNWGNPERFANQYDAFSNVYNPIMMNYKSPKRGEVNKINAWGCTVSWAEDQPGMFPVHKPGTIVMPDVEAWKEVVKAPKTDYTAADWEPFIEAAEKIDRSKYFVTEVVVPGIFETSHYLGEISNILMAFYESPDELKEVLKYIQEYEMRIAEGICTYVKPDAFFHHDDWGSATSTFVSPDMFDEFILPLYKELYGYYHDHGVEVIMHHSDSYGKTLVPEMIEMGIDIWQGVLAINDIPELLKQYKGQITFMGGVNNSVIDHAGWTEEEVKSVVFDICQQCGPRGFIPCMTGGSRESTFPGVYEAVHDAIDEYSKIYFAEE